MDTGLHHNMHARAGSTPAPRRISGFTLPEILAAVGIVSILGAMAGPSFSDLIAAQRSRTASTDLYLSLVKARSEAIKRNTNVTLSPKVGGWHTGWEIVDPSDSTRKLDEHNPITRAVITGPDSVVYQATGRVRGSTQPAFDFSITGTDAVACVKVDLSGLPTQKSSSC
jgi:type IV fimbrial biogenesis protein FimT